MNMSDDTLRVLQVLNLDEMYDLNVTKGQVEPVIINLLNLSNPDYVDHLSDLIFADGRGIDFTARCQCGHLEGDPKIGMVCPICGTTVTKTTLLDDDNLMCRYWLSSPAELPLGWLAPKVYLTLAKWLEYTSVGKVKRNYIDDILDVETPIPYDLQQVVTGKGFDYLAKNFDAIIDFFCFNHPVISKRPDTAAMHFFIQHNRDKIFCHYIPVLNSAINPIVEDTRGGQRRRYSDTTADNVLRAANSLSSLEFQPKRKKNRDLHVERVTFRAYKDIITYSRDAMSKYISVKRGIPRSHVYGARLHQSFRGVISPIIGPHNYWELHVPWRMAVNSLRVPILGILSRDHGMSPQDAAARHRRGLQMIDPLIKEIMDQLIADSPFKGIPVLWHRPPSIRDGSVMLKFWTKIKTDLNDRCVSMSPLVLSPSNADKSSQKLFTHSL